MAVGKELLLKIADIAAISIDETEAEDYAKELDSVIVYIEQKLSEIPDDDLEPMEHVLSAQSFFRADEVTNFDRKAELLGSASVTKDGCHFVPSVVDPS